jgi:hypothetical protein
MKKRYALAAAVATCIVALAPLSAHANTLTDILDFNPYNSGSNPVGAFAVGPLSGNLGFNILYGVTATGGGYGYGATFMLTPVKQFGRRPYLPLLTALPQGQHRNPVLFLMRTEFFMEPLQVVELHNAPSSPTGQQRHISAV